MNKYLMGLVALVSSGVNKIKTVAVAAFAVVGGLVISSTPAQAAIVWDFTDITDEVTGLGTAIVAALALAIAAGLTIFGIKKAWGVIASMVSRVMNKG